MPTVHEGAAVVSGLGEEVTHRPWARRVAPWAAWCVFFVPVTIVLHELGHYATARWLGFPNPVLHYSSISPGDVTTRPVWLSGVVGLAGPAITIILALIACGWVFWRRPSRWAFALAISAASRFVVGVPYTVANVVVRVIGATLQPPAFDEYKAGVALRWSGDALLASTALVLVAVLLCVGVKLPRGERSVAWPGLLIGTALGWALWMKLLGPVLLP
jgi:hypothetical protein